MFTAGNSYEAKLINAGLEATKSGDPQVFMEFIAKDTATGEKEPFKWTGSLKAGKAQELTIKALLTAGFTGSDIDDLKNDPKPFDPDATIFVQLEEMKDREGNPTGKLRVQWVNGAPKAKPFMGSAGKFAGAFQKARQELGIKDKSKTGW